MSYDADVARARRLLPLVKEGLQLTEAATRFAISHSAKHWHDRAALMRALAETMTDVETHAIMLRLAADYDELVDRSSAGW
jgi:hypothetical protein